MVFGVCCPLWAMGRVFQKVHVQPTTPRLIACFPLSRRKSPQLSVGNSQTDSAVLRWRVGRGLGVVRRFLSRYHLANVCRFPQSFLCRGGNLGKSWVIFSCNLSRAHCPYFISAISVCSTPRHRYDDIPPRSSCHHT